MKRTNHSLGKHKKIRIGRRIFMCGVVAASVPFTTGCQNITRRGQSPDEQSLTALASVEQGQNYIGDVCSVWGLDFAKVQGIGIAVGLDGTGSNPVDNSYRDHLEKELRSRAVDDIDELLADDGTSMVILRGVLPPAIRKGERFDIEVKVAPLSDTTSLEGARLMKTRLRPMVMFDRRVTEGKVTSLAQGDVFIDGLFEVGDDKAKQQHGWVFGGGVATEDRPIGLGVRTESTSVRTTTAISRAINARFSRSKKSGRRGVATPKTDRVIELDVPVEYKHNIGRFVQAIQNTAFNETATDRVNRLEKLEQELGQPSLSRIASLRLEAIGDDALPILRRALQNADLEVKFHAAQALAYMQVADCVDTLEFIAAKEPAFRWHCLTALASVSDVTAGEALGRLMNVDSSETRYGAFRAMMARSPEDPMVTGDWLANSFHFHVIESETTQPMLHFARSKRPEITVFGHEQTLGDGFIFVEPGLTVRSIGNQKIQVTSFGRKGETRKTCSNQVADLIQTLGAIGVEFGSQLKMFRYATETKHLDARLVMDAVPHIRRDLQSQTESYAAPAEDKSNDKFRLGRLPELFRTAEISDPKPRRADNWGVADEDDAKNESKIKQTWTKMKGWFGKKSDDDWSQ